MWANYMEFYKGLVEGYTGKRIK
ncbi:Protein of unknown function [Bacillus wiedmannii]|nr:Protein of unknown function [Bacillus wiedmannii]